MKEPVAHGVREQQGTEGARRFHDRRRRAAVLREVAVPLARIEVRGAPAVAAFAERGRVQHRRDDEGQHDADDACEAERLGERGEGEGAD
eukprot:scaffold24676_cov61-Phaeocystis_antarctica.AAC.8